VLTAEVDPALVIVVVVVAVTVASVLVYRGIGPPLDRWRERAGEPVAGRAPDGNLREEIRSLVVANNERRARRGEEPLDVDVEVERRMRELDIN
jgi:peptidoglycan/LPS O-acetylase OafA/YrhL